MHPCTHLRSRPRAEWGAGGRERTPGRSGSPRAARRKVKTHDLVEPDLGKAAPYGVYDLTHKGAWVSVGTDHDTAAFPVQALRTWWQTMGHAAYPDARRLLVVAESPTAATATAPTTVSGKRVASPGQRERP